MKYVYIMFLLITLWGCTKPSIRHDLKNVQDIISNQSIYLGEQVSVKGYLRYGDDAKNIWVDGSTYSKLSDSNIKPSDPAWKMCLGIYKDASLWKKLRRLDKENVIITGKLVIRKSDEVIYLGRCRALGIEIESIEIDRSGTI